MGAKVTLTLPDGSVRETETDDFGDFWFRNLEPGTYAVSLEAPGYAPASREAIQLDKSLNIGRLRPREGVKREFPSPHLAGRVSIRVERGYS